MAIIKTKHFQYAGLDDYDKSVDDQINDFLASECIDKEHLIDIKYFAHSTEGINYYTALVVYKSKN